MVAGISGKTDGAEAQLERGVFEEADFEARRKHAAGWSFECMVEAVVVTAQETEAGEARVGVGGELEAGGDEGAVEVERVAELELEEELDLREADDTALAEPAAGGGKDFGDGREDVPALFVGGGSELNGRRFGQGGRRGRRFDGA
jgi:hypothetical protein